MKTKKAMKKITNIGMAALVAMGMLGTSCNKAESPEIETPETQKENIVTLTTTVGFAADGTKALTGTGVKTFAEGETMAIYYYKNKGNDREKAVSTPLTAGDITNGGKSATFTFTLDNPYKDQSVAYIYPAAMANADFTPNYDALYNNQDGTRATLASNFDFCTKSGAWNGDNLPSLTLENQLAILAITLKNADGSSDITSSITGLTLSDGTNSYAVTRSAAAGPIYVAIRPTSSASIEVTATTGTTVYTKSLTDKTYAASNGYPLSWMMTEQTGATGGFFSVSDTKKVYFSKGNLRYTSGAWSFFDNQWDYYTTYSADSWDKFGWSTSATTYGMNTSTSSGDYSGDFVDWGSNSALQTALGSGWRTLSMDEWTYLLKTRTVNGGTGENKSYTLNTTVKGKRCLVLYPDNYTGAVYSGSDWASFEAAGCVFLPAAGWRNGTTINNTNDRGFYWSSSSHDTTAAKRLFFAAGLGDLTGDNSHSRAFGFSVRLVREVE